MLRPFWSFYGSKWRVALRYPAPTHSVIVEPFAGGAGYATRYADHQVILVDSDPVIAGLWRWLLTASPQEILELPDLEDGQTVDDLPICQEARWLMGFWLNKGATRPRRRASSWQRSGIRPDSTWGAAVRDRLSWQITRIRHWKIIEGDHTAAPDLDATWFVDPPYQHAGSHYRHGSSRLNYAALSAWCRERKGQVMVCENVGANWLPFEPWLTSKSNESKHGGKQSREALWQQPPPLRLFKTGEAP